MRMRSEVAQHVLNLVLNIGCLLAPWAFESPVIILVCSMPILVMFVIPPGLISLELPLGLCLLLAVVVYLTFGYFLRPATLQALVYNRESGIANRKLNDVYSKSGHLDLMRLWKE